VISEIIAGLGEISEEVLFIQTAATLFTTITSSCPQRNLVLFSRFSAQTVAGFLQIASCNFRRVVENG
jgi:hypothetical protein